MIIYFANAVRMMLKAEPFDAAAAAAAAAAEADSKGKSSKGGKTPAKGAAAAPLAVADEPALQVDVDDQADVIKEDQVELMRDRKLLEMEATQRRLRERLADEATNR